MSHFSTRYTLYEPRWPEGQTLTYSFPAAANFLFGIDDGLREFAGRLGESERALVRDAFDSWASVCGVELVEVEDAADVDIRIGWGLDTDGSGGALATTHTWFRGDTTVAVSIVFDTHDRTQFDDDGVFFTAVLHEIGHALGIAHSDVDGAVMGLYGGSGMLTADDVAAAQALWGEPYQSTNGDDSIVGHALGERILGRGGDDTVSGEGGDDTLVGGTGDDHLNGGDGNDHRPEATRSAATRAMTCWPGRLAMTRSAEARAMIASSADTTMTPCEVVRVGIGSMVAPGMT